MSKIDAGEFIRQDHHTEFDLPLIHKMQEELQDPTKEILMDLPDNIEAVIDTAQLSPEELKQVLQSLLASQLSLQLMPADLEKIELFLKQLTALSPAGLIQPSFTPETEKAVVAKALAEQNQTLTDVKPNKDVSKATLVATTNETASATKQQTTQIEELPLVKTMMVSADSVQLQQQPLQASTGIDNATKALIETYNNEIKAIQRLAELGTKVTLNGNLVSVHGQQGMLATENIAAIIARGDGNFIDSSRSMAFSEGYVEFNQQQGDQGKERQNNQDDSDQFDGDTLFHVED